MTEGSTFFLKMTGEFYDENGHLWILISPKTADPVVIVSFTSCIAGGFGQDNACIVYPGEHPFLKKPTFVAYFHARIVPSATLRAYEANDQLHFHDPLSPGLLKKVQAGALASKRIPLKIKNLLKLQLPHLDKPPA